MTKSWSLESRKLAIYVRDPKALPRPARLLFEHLRREVAGSS